MAKKVGRPADLSNQISKKIELRYLSNIQMGVRLPSELCMAKELNVSRGTIRSALRILESRRRISRQPSKRSRASGWMQQRICMDVFEILVGDYRSGYRYRLADVHWQLVLWGICSAFSGLRADVVLSFHDLETMNSLGEMCERHFARDSIKGLLLLGEQHASVYSAAARIRKPIVVVDDDASAQGLDSVCFADEDAGKYLVQRLLMLGHRRFLVVRESPSRSIHQQDQAWQKRSRGVLNALKAHNLSPQIINLETRGDIATQAATRVMALLRKPADERPTALIIPGLADPIEWQALAKDAGLALPRDITIAGFGGAHEDPTITGIRFDSRLLGHTAGNILRQFVLGSSKPQSTGKVALVKGVYVAGTTHGRAHKESQ